MALTPVQRRSVPDDVYDQLVDEIVGGELPAGSPLPSERRLAEALGVSRPAVREALQRLAAGGLIDVRQGDATTVRDYLRSAGPELLPRLLLRDGSPDLAVVRAIMEARFALMPDVARRCATRRSEETAAELERLVARMADEVDDLPTVQRTAHELSSVLVDGSGNVVYRLLFNALEAAYLPAMDALAHVLADELTDLDGYAALVAAVRNRDGGRAAAAGRRLIGRGTEAALAVLDELEAAR
ncbi:FadR family transcriptional regulator [Nitriliruptoraceae bacterium ZYF776]|nr:FadR family transcriptional regulator [Profundirhabdus halotolerans]